VILTGIAIGLVLGLLAGGRISNLGSVRLRWVPLLVLALILRFGTELLLANDVPIAETLRVPLLATSFGLLLAGIWVNRTYPGMTLAFVGTLSNGLAILVNGGFMPIWEPSLVAAGFTTADVSTEIHTILPATLDASFLLHLGPLADVIPIPFPLIQTVASIGDLFLMLGLAFFLFASVVRAPEDATGSRETGLSPAMSGVASLDRPVVLGGQPGRLASPARVVLQREEPVGGERIRQHPYVRLALNGSFSALWAGQLISIFGDRINTVALVAIVFGVTESFTAGALAFVVATLPNLLLSPIAGTFVDRWDRKEVLVVSDILRAALVLLIPLAVIVNLLLAYVLIFLVTAVSIFFRPARVAILPQIVEDDELVTANSAMWIGETAADILGYAIAGLLVAALKTALPLAFWLDAVTYLASAVLLATMVVRPVDQEERERAAANRDTLGFVGQMREGFHFLRKEPTLQANTIQAAVAQCTVGALLALMYAYAAQVYESSGLDWKAVYGFLETSVGAGNLVGGFVIGLIGARLAKGHSIIGGYVVFGLFTILLALSSQLPIALAFGFGAGVANMAFIIPSQTLFQERTPAALMGRVVSFRFALVFGAMTVAAALASVLLIFLSASVVLVMFSVVTICAGLAGWFAPALRDA
jgi:MFS family permease